MSAVVVWEDMGTDGRVGKGCRVQLLGSHGLPALGRCCSEPWSHKGTEHVVPARRHAAAARGEEATMTRQCGDFALGTDSSERSSVRPSHGISALCWELHQVTGGCAAHTGVCALRLLPQMSGQGRLLLTSVQIFTLYGHFPKTDLL